MSGLKIVCLGGGPASLYFAILMKKANPAHDITVIERGPRDATWGFGVVFSDETLMGFLDADPQSYKRIVEQFVYYPLLGIHVLLAIASVPLVIYVLLLALTYPVRELPDTRHPQVGRVAAALWLISFALGTAVYVMLYVVF